MAIFGVKIDSFENPCHLTRFFRVFLRVGDIIFHSLGKKRLFLKSHLSVVLAHFQVNFSAENRARAEK